MTGETIGAHIRVAFDNFGGPDIAVIVKSLRAAYAEDTAQFKGALIEMAPSKTWPESHYWFNIGGAGSLADSVFNLGVLYADQDLDDRAVECFAESADLGLAFGDLAAGELLVWLGQHSQAEPRLLRARATIEDATAQANAGALLGVVFFERDGRSDDEVVELLSDPSADTGKFAYTLAKVAEARGDEGKARLMFEQLLFSGDPQSALDLGNLLWRANELDLAESVFREGVKLGNWRCVYNLGSLLLEVGRIPEGTQLINQAAQDGDDKAIAHLLRLGN